MRRPFIPINGHKLVKSEHFHFLTCNPKTNSLNISVFLPLANEVWGKVMFSQIFVCPQGRGLHQGGSASGDLHMRWPDSPSLYSRGRGICIWGGGGLGRPLPGTRKGGGTHPTGMLSFCYI